MAQRESGDWIPNILNILLFGGRGKKQNEHTDLSLYVIPENGESAFDTMLRLSTQKARTADVLARRILTLSNRGNLRIADIGVSKGTQFAMTAGILRALKFERQIDFTLVEPDLSSARILQSYADAIKDMSGGNFVSKIINGKLENIDLPPDLDAVICSHMIYHLPPDQLRSSLAKMINALRYDYGEFYLIARDNKGNQVLDFIKECREVINEKVNDVTINDALPHLDDIVSQDPNLSLHFQTIYANVTLPFLSTPADAQTLVAFFLQKPSWEEVDPRIQSYVMDTYGGTNLSLEQVDRCYIVTRVGSIDESDHATPQTV